MLHEGGKSEKGRNYGLFNEFLFRDVCTLENKNENESK